MADALTNIIREFIDCRVPARRRLPRGLALAYRPPEAENRLHTLSISRIGIIPSNEEESIIRDILKRILAGGEFLELPARPFKWKKGDEGEEHFGFRFSWQFQKVNMNDLADWPPKTKEGEHEQRTAS